MQLTHPAPLEERQAHDDGDDTTIPFSWDQFAVIHQSAESIKQFHAYDPVLMNVSPTFVLQPTVPVNVTVVAFDTMTGLQDVHAKANTEGLSEAFQFQALARGILSAPATYTYNIVGTNTVVRGTPDLQKSPADIIKPGQLVRYVWNPVSGTNRFAHYEALLTGKTSLAKGIETSVISRMTAVKAQPIVLGHYLMTVTPRDVRGQPALGSMSNGQVVRCAFGSNPLPPVTDGFSADTFYPAPGQLIHLSPNATDPQTGQTSYANEAYEFGDGVTATGVAGPTTYTYSAPGIYRVRCTLANSAGLFATAEDSVVVGATTLPKLPFKFLKQIPPEEAGEGLNGADTLQVTFKDPSKTKLQPGDRLVLLYNRNQFGRNYVSDNADDTDIVLKTGLTFTGKTRIARNVTVAAAGGAVTITVNGAQFDRTGDPRLGRCELKGIFKNQRIALSIIPADGSTPRVLLYTGNMAAQVKGGQFAHGFYIFETVCAGTTTTKQPNLNKQDP